MVVRPAACLRDPSPADGFVSQGERFGPPPEGSGPQGGRQAQSLLAYAHRRASARLPSRQLREARRRGAGPERPYVGSRSRHYGLFSQGLKTLDRMRH